MDGELSPRRSVWLATAPSSARPLKSLKGSRFDVARRSATRRPVSTAEANQAAVEVGRRLGLPASYPTGPSDDTTGFDADPAFWDSQSATRGSA